MAASKERNETDDLKHGHRDTLKKYKNILWYALENGW